MLKLRDLGFAKKFELKEVDYFVHEARYWLAKEAQREGDTHARMTPRRRGRGKIFPPGARRFRAAGVPEPGNVNSR